MFGMDQKDLLLYAGAGVGGLVVLFVLFKILTTPKPRHKDLQKGQREKLDEYPDAPPARDDRRLLFDGLGVRLRFVAVAPTGKKQDPIEVEEVAEILDEVIRGLSAFVKSDKARIRVWPPQLSVAGFAPTFFRLVESPDAPGAKSHWIRVAGPVKVGGRPMLVGLALYSEETTKLGMVGLEATQWNDRLDIEK